MGSAVFAFDCLKPNRNWVRRSARRLERKPIETADKLNAAGKEFAIERRREIEATVSRMKADAAAAEKKLQELARAGTESWSTLNAALAETRATFDRANQATRDAFKRALSSAQ